MLSQKICFKVMPELPDWALVRAQCPDRLRVLPCPGAIPWSSASCKRLAVNLRPRPRPRECVHLVTRGHFRSRDKGGVTP